METKIIPIKWNGKDEEVEIKRFTFGELLDIREQSITTRTVGTTIQRSVSQKSLQMASVLKGIKNAPFAVESETIKNLPGFLGDKLYTEIDNFNTVTPEKKKARLGLQTRNSRPRNKQDDNPFRYDEGVRINARRSR